MTVVLGSGIGLIYLAHGIVLVIQYAARHHSLSAVFGSDFSIAQAIRIHRIATFTTQYWSSVWFVMVAPGALVVLARLGSLL